MSGDTLRADKWLWYARFFKSRTQASRLCASNRLRINGNLIGKAHHPVRPGDVLTFPRARLIRVVRVMALGARRGPATEARALYEDLEPPPSRDRAADPGAVPSGRRRPGEGRPTKADRRAIDRLRDGE